APAAAGSAGSALGTGEATARASREAGAGTAWATRTAPAIGAAGEAIALALACGLAASGTGGALLGSGTQFALLPIAQQGPRIEDHFFTLEQALLDLGHPDVAAADGDQAFFGGLIG